MSTRSEAENPRYGRLIRSAAASFGMDLMSFRSEIDEMSEKIAKNASGRFLLSGLSRIYPSAGDEKQKR